MYTQTSRNTADVVSLDQNLPFGIPKSTNNSKMVACVVLCLPAHFALTPKMAFQVPMRPVHGLPVYTTNALDGDAYINTSSHHCSLIHRLLIIHQKEVLTHVMVWVLLLLSSKLWTEATCRLPAPESQKAHTQKPLLIPQKRDDDTS